MGLKDTHTWHRGLGVKSSFEMAVGSKLMLTYTLDMWNFSESTLGFLLNYGSIGGRFWWRRSRD